MLRQYTTPQIASELDTLTSEVQTNLVALINNIDAKYLMVTDITESEIVLMFFKNQIKYAMTYEYTLPEFPIWFISQENKQPERMYQLSEIKTIFE